MFTVLASSSGGSSATTDPYVYLISALISAVVALGIELVAKPRLEARKERILADHRSRLTFDARLTKIITMAATWAQFEEPTRGSDEFRDRLENERSRALQELDGITQELMDDLGSYAGTYVAWNPRVLGASAPALVAKYVFIVRGISLSDRSAADKFRELRDVSLAMQQALFSYWHPVRRARALRDLPGILGKYGYQPSGTAASQPSSVPAQNSESEGESPAEDDNTQSV